MRNKLKILFGTLVFAGVLTGSIFSPAKAEEQKNQFNLIYEMKVVKFWHINVNWRNQTDYPVAGEKSKKLYKRVSQILSKAEKENSLLKREFKIR
jgi:hypothetical protein